MIKYFLNRLPSSSTRASAGRRRAMKLCVTDTAVQPSRSALELSASGCRRIGCLRIGGGLLPPLLLPLFILFLPLAPGPLVATRTQAIKSLIAIIEKKTVLLSHFQRSQFLVLAAPGSARVLAGIV